ncbi:hypothetical protein MTsDn5_34560 [Alteromonas gracilis]
MGRNISTTLLKSQSNKKLVRGWVNPPYPFLSFSILF